MITRKKWRAWLVPGLYALAGCALHVDGGALVKRGDVAKSIYVVDGAVELAPQAHARSVHTVDGEIHLNRWASAGALRSVDGAITLDDGAVCARDVRSVDGRITLADGVRVSGDVANDAGDIEVHGALIEGQLQDVSGQVRLTGATHVERGIVLPLPDPSKSVNNPLDHRLPVVVIGPGVTVNGPITARRGGVLWVSRQAHIGAVSGITVHWFDGEAPSNATIHSP